MTADVRFDRHWTVADYMAMDDDERYEIIRGAIHVVPAPSDAHQRVITRLGTFIDMHVITHELGECRDAPFDVVLSEDTVVQPDFTYISKSRVAEVLDKQGAVAAPDLVIEVLSPDSTRRDRLQKRNLYAEFGVEWFIIVDPVSQVVEVFQLNDAREYVVRPGASGNADLVIGCFPDLSIDLSKVWPPDS